MTAAVQTRRVSSVDELLREEVGLSGASLLVVINETETVDGHLVATDFEIVGLVLDDAAITRLAGVPVRPRTLIRRGDAGGHTVIDPGYPVDYEEERS